MNPHPQWSRNEVATHSAIMRNVTLCVRKEPVTLSRNRGRRGNDGRRSRGQACGEKKTNMPTANPPGTRAVYTKQKPGGGVVMAVPMNASNAVHQAWTKKLGGNLSNKKHSCIRDALGAKHCLGFFMGGVGVTIKPFFVNQSLLDHFFWGGVYFENSQEIKSMFFPRRLRRGSVFLFPLLFDCTFPFHFLSFHRSLFILLFTFTLILIFFSRLPLSFPRLPCPPFHLFSFLMDGVYHYGRVRSRTRDHLSSWAYKNTAHETKTGKYTPKSHTMYQKCRNVAKQQNTKQMTHFNTV